MKTTQEGRDRARQFIACGDSRPLSTRFILALLDDADELARLRRHIEMQRNQWLEREREYKRGCDGARAAEAGFTADTLNLLLNNGDGDE